MYATLPDIFNVQEIKTKVVFFDSDDAIDIKSVDIKVKPLQDLDEKEGNDDTATQVKKTTDNYELIGEYVSDTLYYANTNKSPDLHSSAHTPIIENHVRCDEKAKSKSNNSKKERKEKDKRKPINSDKKKSKSKTTKSKKYFKDDKEDKYFISKVDKYKLKLLIQNKKRYIPGNESNGNTRPITDLKINKWIESQQKEVEPRKKLLNQENKTEELVPLYIDRENSLATSQINSVESMPPPPRSMPIISDDQNNNLHENEIKIIPKIDQDDVEDQITNYEIKVKAKTKPAMKIKSFCFEKGPNCQKIRITYPISKPSNESVENYALKNIQSILNNFNDQNNVKTNSKNVDTMNCDVNICFDDSKPDNNLSTKNVPQRTVQNYEPRSDGVSKTNYGQEKHQDLYVRHPPKTVNVSSTNVQFIQKYKDSVNLQGTVPPSVPYQSINKIDTNSKNVDKMNCDVNICLDDTKPDNNLSTENMSQRTVQNYESRSDGVTKTNYGQEKHQDLYVRHPPKTVNECSTNVQFMQQYKDFVNLQRTVPPSVPTVKRRNYCKSKRSKSQKPKMKTKKLSANFKSIKPNQVNKIQANSLLLQNISEINNQYQEYLTEVLKLKKYMNTNLNAPNTLTQQQTRHNPEQNYQYIMNQQKIIPISGSNQEILHPESNLKIQQQTMRIPEPNVNLLYPVTNQMHYIQPNGIPTNNPPPYNQLYPNHIAMMQLMQQNKDFVNLQRTVPPSVPYQSINKIDTNSKNVDKINCDVNICLDDSKPDNNLSTENMSQRTVQNYEPRSDGVTKTNYGQEKHHDLYVRHLSETINECSTNGQFIQQYKDFVNLPRTVPAKSKSKRSKSQKPKMKTKKLSANLKSIKPNQVNKIQANSLLLQNISGINNQSQENLTEVLKLKKYMNTNLNAPNTLTQQQTRHNPEQNYQYSMNQQKIISISGSNQEILHPESNHMIQQQTMRIPEPNVNLLYPDTNQMHYIQPNGIPTYNPPPYNKLYPDHIAMIENVTRGISVPASNTNIGPTSLNLTENTFRGNVNMVWNQPQYLYTTPEFSPLYATAAKAYFPRRSMSRDSGCFSPQTDCMDFHAMPLQTPTHRDAAVSSESMSIAPETTCIVCNTRTKSGCLECQKSYCSTKCKYMDWDNHQYQCNGPVNLKK